MARSRLGVLLAIVCLPTPALAVDLVMNGGSATLGGVHNYGMVSLTNGATITVPPFDGVDRINTGNLVIHADTITIDATSRIIAKGSGYQGKLCDNGPGPASVPLAGGRGGCSLRDSGGGGGHFGGGGRGTKDNPASYPAGYEEDCLGAVNGAGNACVDLTDCRNNDGLPTVAGQSFFHSIWANEFGAAGGDKGCRDGDGFPPAQNVVGGNGGGRIVLAAVNPGQTGALNIDGIVRADGNRGCGFGNDSAGGGAGGSVLLVAADCLGSQACVNGRCAPCNCTPCTTVGNACAAPGQTCTNLAGALGKVCTTLLPGCSPAGTCTACATVGNACATPGQICVDLGGAIGKVCANPANSCTAFDVTDNENECVGKQNSGLCDDCGGGGGGGIINVMSRTRTINVGATFNIAGAVGGICPVCTGEAGGGAGELLIDGAYIGEVCDGFDNDFDGVPDNGFPNATCGQGLCSSTIATCTAGSPPICAPANGPDPTCLGSRGTSRPRIALLLDTSASMLQTLAGTVTFGDGSADHPGIDLNSNGKPDDSKLFLAKDASSQLIAAYPEIDFALARYHQDEGVNRSCQTAKWLECQTVCCSYDNPNNEIVASPTACSLALPKLPSGTVNLTVHEDSTLASRCINYAGTCGAPRRGADLLVGFESDVRQYMSWLDGGETNFNAGSTPGNYCGGLTGDCELRGSGPTPIAEALRAIYDYVTPIKAIDPASACRGYSVIFVSDGAEECGGNPVAAAGELLAKGIKTYVIGVSVNAAQAAVLTAVAAAGGTTTYIPVTSSNQLLPALVSIVSGSIKTELCNGMDDNCNGQTDEGYNVGAACDNGLKGICKSTGVLECDPADSKKTRCHILVAGQAPAASESCNGKDDNCNGLVDEGNPGGGGSCGSSTGTCLPGTLQCQGGQLVCVGATGAKPEVCNGKDDDCNGSTDDCGGMVNGCDGGACGSSVGECRPGTWKCMGLAGYVCQGATLGSAESCNGKDDDCNGAVDDNVPGTGVACNTLPDGTPLCKPGTVRCLGGQLVCQGGVAFHPPACLCPPDDCTDPNAPGTNDGCPAGSACLDCACRTPCAGGEFPCSGTSVCRGGYCVPPECGGRLCASWEDCIGNTCVDRCASQTCSDGFVCHQGSCVENDCYGVGCPQGQICQAATCVADPCASLTCAEGEFCRAGSCVGTCADVRCEAGQTCRDGACVAETCAPACPLGRVCRDGACVTDLCLPITCGVGRVCQDGACVDDPCLAVHCVGPPSEVVCRDGQCVPPIPLPPLPSADKVVGAGGGGFACDVAVGGAPSGSMPIWALVLVALWLGRRRGLA